MGLMKHGVKVVRMGQPARVRKQKQAWDDMIAVRQLYMLCSSIAFSFLVVLPQSFSSLSRPSFLSHFLVSGGFSVVFCERQEIGQLSLTAEMHSVVLESHHHCARVYASLQKRFLLVS